MAGKMPYDAYAPTMAAMLYTIKPKDGYFTASAPGTLTIGTDGRVTLQPSAQGKHSLLEADPAKREAIQKIYVDMASAKPVAPPRRRLPPQIVAEEEAAAKARQQKKAAPAEPAPEQQP